jgi:RNA polymerase sigma factor (TIGR02999 family)
MEGHEITVLLAQLRNGRDEAVHELLPLGYEQLRAIADDQLDHQAEARTLTPTALVHEAYIKLFDRSQLDLRDRRHFFFVAARAMRQIIVDYARGRLAQKRGGQVQHVSLDGVEIVAEGRHEDAIDLDEALDHLYELNERCGRVVELRFFGGFSVEEVADLLGIAPSTVKRDWRTARALLFRHLKRSGTS